MKSVYSCNHKRLTLELCVRGSCRSWRRAHEKYLELVFRPSMPLRKSAGKFVVGFDWEKP